MTRTTLVPLPPTYSFDIYTLEPVIVQTVLDRQGPVTVEIVAWRLEESGFMGSMSTEFDQRAVFELNEPAGTLAELTVARDDDFNDLRLQIDRDADGTVDAEQPPTSVSDEE
ncbi:MAG: hypothetical protein WEC79_00855 [Thermomicrobiales bacterium]